MMRHVLDTGPLVGYLDRRDASHAWAVETLDAINGPLRTCESVVSEACFVLRGVTGGPQAVLALVSCGRLVVDFRLGEQAVAVERLVARYESVPMSVAAACLVRMTELDANLTVVTVDEDFRVYRRNGRKNVPVLMP